jgi:hypothetical protein
MKRLLSLFVLAVSAFPAAVAQATPGHTVDLASGRVDGHSILGKTIAQVTAALGRPDFRVGPASHHRIGFGTPSDFST